MSHLTTLAALVAVLACTAPLAAAGAQRPAPTTVTLVAQKNLPRGAKVIVEQRPTMTPRNVILVDLDRATATDIAAAVKILAGLQQRTGDDQNATLRAAPRSFTAPPGFEKSHHGKLLTASLVRLLTAPEIMVPGVGRARAVDIEVTLPPGQLRSGQS